LNQNRRFSDSSTRNKKNQKNQRILFSFFAETKFDGPRGFCLSAKIKFPIKSLTSVTAIFGLFTFGKKVFEDRENKNRIIIIM